MKRAIPVEVFNKEGDLMRIEFYDLNGEHIVDAIWDQNDPQDSEHRVSFRSWAYKHLENKDYSVTT